MRRVDKLVPYFREHVAHKGGTARHLNDDVLATRILDWTEFVFDNIYPMLDTEAEVSTEEVLEWLAKDDTGCS